VVEGQDFGSRPDLDCFAGHAEDDAAFLILGDGVGSRAVESNKTSTAGRWWWSMGPWLSPAT
jgi:hypothetical protein